jgi:hypothetical protein
VAVAGSNQIVRVGVRVRTHFETDPKGWRLSGPYFMLHVLPVVHVCNVSMRGQPWAALFCFALYSRTFGLASATVVM